MKKYFVILSMFLITMCAFPQITTNTINTTTTIPILYINPNPQIGGFGEIGTVASLNDEAGLTQNPALLSRNKKTVGITTNLSTWTSYNPNTYLGNLGLHYSIDSNNTIGYSFNYFNIGNIHFNNNNNTVSKPYEYYHSFRYAHSFSEKLSAGIGLKVIKSDLAPNIKTSFYTFSIDLGIDYRKQFYLSNKSNLRWDLGISGQDIGPKINYSNIKTQTGDNIPIDIATGTMLSYYFWIKEKTSLNFNLAYQIETIVVPTPMIYANSSNGWINEIQKGNNSGLTPVEGYFGSFELKPNNYNMKSFNFINKLGAEINLNIKEKFIFTLRSGKVEEFASKGGAKYNTLGAGIGLYGFRFDYSKLFIPTNSIDAFSVSYTIKLKNK